MRKTRRQFLLGTATGGVTFAVVQAANRLPWVSAAEAQLPPEMAQFTPDIEPLVRKMERIPREQCVSMTAEEIRAGTSYRRFLAALFLAAIRKSNSHHEVYAIHAAHQMSLDARPEERFLPLIWALDSFKQAQENFPAPPLRPLPDAPPSAADVVAEFNAGMAEFDAERSERAVAALFRNRGVQGAQQQVWHYAARDWGFIGHKAIAAANSKRTLDTIGWRHAEPALRFVVSQFYSPFSPCNEQVLKKQCYYDNLARVQEGFAKLRPDWASAESDPEAALALLDAIRETRVDPACRFAFRQLAQEQASAATVWDAIHLAAAEHVSASADSLLGTRPLHAVTTANALHYAFNEALDPELRMLILLQAVGWLTETLGATKAKGLLRERKITDLTGHEIPATEEDAVENIFAVLSDGPGSDSPNGNKIGPYPSNETCRDGAAARAFSFAQRYPESRLFFERAVQMTLLKSSTNAHNYKFPAAVFEDYRQVSPRWRPHLLAASVQFLYGSQRPNAPVIEEALRTLA